MTKAIIYMREIVIFLVLGDATHPDGQVHRSH